MSKYLTDQYIYEGVKGHRITENNAYNPRSQKITNSQSRIRKYESQVIRAVQSRVTENKKNGQSRITENHPPHI